MESQPGREPRDWETLRRWDPERIGPYVVLGRLGSGSMGQVYLGRSAAGRLVAVKTIRVELAEEADRNHRVADRAGGGEARLDHRVDQVQPLVETRERALHRVDR